jgi:hypothetical protein
VRPGAAPGDARGRRRRRGLSHKQLRTIGVTVLAGVLWTLLTIATFTGLPRYDLPGEPYLDNLDFRDGFRDWETSGIVTLDEVELGLATLQNRNPDEAVYLRRTIALPPGQTSLLLSADLETYQVRRGEEPWQAARIYLVQQTRDGAYVWNQPHQLIELVGTTGRQHFEQVFEVPATIHRVLLGIELPYATGRFDVANLRLALLDELPLFRLAATVLVAGWCLLGIWVVSHTMRGIRSPKVRTLLLVTCGAMLAGIFMPATLRQELIDRLASGFGLDVASPDTVGHAMIFALLALLVRSGRRHDPLLLHFSCWLLVGAAAEVLQLLVVDRTPQASDWLADATGACLGLLLAEVGLRLERHLEPPPKPRPGRQV